MARVKQPLLSMEMSGTIGGSLTGQRTRRVDILREKPTPRDPYSLAQAYQRWDYQDYLAWWETLTPAEKQAYAAAGSRTHNTAVGAFLQEKLSTLPDIIGRWRLDELSGATARDSGKGGHHSTIFGASPADGVIAGARYFDGINDRIDLPIAAAFTPDMTFLWFTKATFSGLADAKIKFCGTHHSLGGNYQLQTFGKTPCYFRVPFGVAGQNTSLGNLADDVWICLAVTLAFDGANTRIRAYQNGLQTGTHTPVGQIVTPDTYYGLGRWWGDYFKGYIDHYQTWNRTLTPSDILRWSERRYSLK